jgi:ATP-dependent DNA helicase RecG
MRATVNKGQQCYVVCPLIKDSESEKMDGVESVETIYRRLKDAFVNDNISIAMLTGKQSSSEVEETIGKFAKNEINILISTTVIEVGVNVPNASVIVIRNAERFGLAQLHQLRGRVGRGTHQSYCVLCSGDTENMRLDAMCKTNNGFEIANADLKQRGTGDLIGTQQSGENKYVALMLQYPNFYLKIKAKVKSLIEQSNMLR